MKRSPEREQFLRDILCTLAEGGLSFGCGDCAAVERTPDLEYVSVTVRYPDENDTGTDGHRFTIEDMARALSMVRETVMTEDQDAAVKRLGISREWRNRMILAYRENDAGQIDAVDASNLAEIAFFGEVRYA